MPIPGEVSFPFFFFFLENTSHVVRPQACVVTYAGYLVGLCRRGKRRHCFLILYWEPSSCEVNYPYRCVPWNLSKAQGHFQQWEQSKHGWAPGIPREDTVEQSIRLVWKSWILLLWKIGSLTPPLWPQFPHLKYWVGAGLGGPKIFSASNFCSVSGYNRRKIPLLFQFRPMTPDNLIFLAQDQQCLMPYLMTFYHSFSKIIRNPTKGKPFKNT